MRVRDQGIIAGGVTSIALSTILAVIEMLHVAGDLISLFSQKSVHSIGDFLSVFDSMSELENVGTLTVLLLMLISLGVIVRGIAKVVKEYAPFLLYSIRNNNNDSKISVIISTSKDKISVDLGKSNSVSEQLHAIEQALRR